MRKTFALIAVTVFLGAACATAPKGPAPAPAPEVSAAPAMTMTAAMNPKAFYAAKCAGCHGADGSKGLQGKTAEAVAKALNGYKAKTYGGAKKEIMEARAAQLSDADIQALAKLAASF